MVRYGWGICAVAVMMLAGCQSGTTFVPPTTGTRPGSDPAMVGVASVSRADLQDFLADMAKAHEDKIRLGGWAGTIMLPVGPAFKPYFATMDKENKERLKELKAWAKEHKIDLTFHYTDDVDGHALKMMDDQQEKMIRGDDQANFERDILMEMSSDYDWHLCRTKALLPNVQDAKLKEYLEKCIAMMEGQADETRALLKRYKFE